MMSVLRNILFFLLLSLPLVILLWLIPSSPTRADEAVLASAPKAVAGSGAPKTFQLTEKQVEALAQRDYEQQVEILLLKRKVYEQDRKIEQYNKLRCA